MGSHLHAFMTLAMTLALCAGWTVSGAAAARPIGRDLKDLYDDPLAGKVGAGFWSTKGNKLVDSNGKEVVFSGINWAGMETRFARPEGLEQHTLYYHLDLIASLGFNLIRLPISAGVVNGLTVSDVDTWQNGDLWGLPAILLLDRIVDGAGQRGIKVIIDYHRKNAFNTVPLEHENGLWYDDDHPEKEWIDNLVALAKRYRYKPTVVGLDLFNEAHQTTDYDPYPAHPGPYWDADGVNEPYNYRTAIIRAGEAILAVHPEILLFVEGLDQYNFHNDTYGPWGAIHIGLKYHDISFSVPNRLVLLTKELGPSVYVQKYFKTPDFPANLPAQWDFMWGFAKSEYPILVGEIGGAFNSSGPNYEIEAAWFSTFKDYILANKLSWTFWLWNPESMDTASIMKPDWQTINYDIVNLLKPLMYPGFQPQASQ